MQARLLQIPHNYVVCIHLSLKKTLLFGIIGDCYHEYDILYIQTHLLLWRGGYCFKLSY